MNTSNLRLKYILVGASGSGKTTMGKVLEESLGLRRCITSTTRPMRPGEQDGKDYYFRACLPEAEMFEKASFGGYEYGITHKELTKGDFAILEPQGVRYFREHYPKPLAVIQLQRSNIQVDEDRIARDKDAGFDDVHPDFTVTGETIADMSANLLGVISRLEEKSRCSVDSLIAAAEAKKEVMPHHLPALEFESFAR